MSSSSEISNDEGTPTQLAARQRRELAKKKLLKEKIRIS
jgi:hypothetical protein